MKIRWRWGCRGMIIILLTGSFFIFCGLFNPAKEITNLLSLLKITFPYVLGTSSRLRSTPSRGTVDTHNPKFNTMDHGRASEYSGCGISHNSSPPLFLFPVYLRAWPGSVYSTPYTRHIHVHILIVHMCLNLNSNANDIMQVPAARPGC